MHTCDIYPADLISPLSEPVSLDTVDLSTDSPLCESLAAHDAGPENLCQTTKVGSKIGDWLENLPKTQRQVVLLKFFKDASQTEIAERLSISSPAVHKALRRALESGREDLAEFSEVA